MIEITKIFWQDRNIFWENSPGLPTFFSQRKLFAKLNFILESILQKFQHTATENFRTEILAQKIFGSYKMIAEIFQLLQLLEFLYFENKNEAEIVLVFRKSIRFFISKPLQKNIWNKSICRRKFRILPENFLRMCSKNSRKYTKNY